MIKRIHQFDNKFHHKHFLSPNILGWELHLNTARNYSAAVQCCRAATPCLDRVQCCYGAARLQHCSELQINIIVGQTTEEMQRCFTSYRSMLLLGLAM